MRRNPTWKLLYNPLAVLGAGTGLVASVAVVAVLTVVAWGSGVHLDGPFCPYVSSGTASLPTLIVEALRSWLGIGVLLFGTSALFGGRGRAASYLATAGLAQFPLVFGVILISPRLLGRHLVGLTQPSAVSDPTFGGTSSFLPWLLPLAGLVLWSIVILYLGYKEASHLEGGRAVGSFLIGVTLAVTISWLWIRCLL